MVSRTLHYTFIENAILQTSLLGGTNQAYKQLSSATVKARKKGKLPWNSFSDEGRLACRFCGSVSNAGAIRSIVY